jgi:hypothetical protein
MAVLIYLGVGISSYPTRLPDALCDYVGDDRADPLRERVDALLSEAWLDPADWGTTDLSEAQRHVEDKIRASHPELTEDAVRALGWHFSYASR